MAGVFSDKHPERAKAMSLVAAGSSLITLVILYFYQEDYGRLTIDTSEGHRSVTVEEKHSEQQSLLLNTPQPINAQIIRL
jgi:hypothetical protein